MNIYSFLFTRLSSTGNFDSFNSIKFHDFIFHWFFHNAFALLFTIALLFPITLVKLYMDHQKTLRSKIHLDTPMNIHEFNRLIIVETNLLNTLLNQIHESELYLSKYPGPFNQQLRLHLWGNISLRNLNDVITYYSRRKTSLENIINNFGIEAPGGNAAFPPQE
jgi:hypothetical protein